MSLQAKRSDYQSLPVIAGSEATKLSDAKSRAAGQSPPSRARPTKERGQSLVELAFSLLVLMLLVTGAVEIGLALFQYVTMRDAAQEGALYGSINPDDVAGIEFRVFAAAQDVFDQCPSSRPCIDPADINVTYSDPSLPAQCEGLTGGVPHSISVSITFEHPVTMPIIGAWIGQTINLRAGVTDTILSPACPSP